MPEPSLPAEVRLGRQGRLVTPAPLKQRLHARFAQVPGNRDLADELIAERREEGQGKSAG
jgi:hypothetical protein